MEYLDCIVWREGISQVSKWQRSATTQLHGDRGLTDISTQMQTCACEHQDTCQPLRGITPIDRLTEIELEENLDPVVHMR